MKNQVEEDGILIFQVTKTRRTFKSGWGIKFEPLKNKKKFKLLKADDLKFVPFKSNFPFLKSYALLLICWSITINVRC